MTDSEKKMKRYTSAVERRLNLPRRLKNRVMSDFISSIQARRDSGKTDAEIYAELGNPQKAAAEINEQMKEYTYRKSPWRFLFAACAAYGGARLFGELFTYILYGLIGNEVSVTIGEAASVGIIGGADGPTAIFVTSPPWLSYAVSAALLIAGIWGFFRLSRCRRR